MIDNIEISNLDLRYENCKMKSKSIENNLFASIVANGIRDPLWVVQVKTCFILLDGFKRYRCAQKANIRILPYQILGKTESEGIIKLLRISNAKSLSILEQAKLIDELKNVHKMCNLEIAQLLEKSKSWVSVRTGIIKQMSPFVLSKIFKGDFPVYSFMYTLRQFIRINSVPKKDVDDFVKAVSGKGLSIRDIEILANGYFKGGDNIRKQIQEGNLSWGLSRLKKVSADQSGCTEIEKKLLSDFEISQKYMQRIISKSNYIQLKTESFYAQANILCDGILRIINTFSKTMEKFHDITRQKKSHLPSS